MTRKAESNEPLIEQATQDVFQHHHPLPVDLDQVVVGTQNSGDLALVKNRKQRDLEVPLSAYCDILPCRLR
jgi:hypothetical protein